MSEYNYNILIAFINFNAFSNLLYIYRNNLVVE